MSQDPFETKDWNTIHERLMEPFSSDSISFLPKGKPTKNGDILALAYIQARDVMNRLDDVVGPGNWSFDWTPMNADGKAVKGTLTVLGVTRSDVGESDKEEEPWKSAVSDALKRVGVQFGIGRFLYELPQVWVKAEAYTINNKEYYKFADRNDPHKKLLQLMNQRQQTSPGATSAKPMSTPAQIKRMGDIAPKAFTGDDVNKQFSDWLTKEFGQRIAKNLTNAQADEAINRLDVMAREKAGAKN